MQFKPVDDCSDFIESSRHEGIVACSMRAATTVGAVSGMMSPVGPEAPTVYWVRRGAVALVALTVLIGLWWLIGGGSSSDPVSNPSPAVSASASPAATAVATPVASTPALVPVSDPTAPCPDANIEVTATSDSSTYVVGSTPRLTLGIQNMGTFACTRDIGPKSNALAVTSGGYPVWSSDDCDASDVVKDSVLQPGQLFRTTITWDGRKAAASCDKQGAFAKAGTYDVSGTNGAVESVKTPFAITAKR